MKWAKIVRAWFKLREPLASCVLVGSIQCARVCVSSGVGMGTSSLLVPRWNSLVPVTFPGKEHFIKFPYSFVL